MIVVADSSVLISLEAGQLLHLFSAVGLEVRLSSLMTRGEMRSLVDENPGLVQRSEVLSKQEIIELQTIKTEYVALSPCDISAFLVAKRLEFTLLTDDRRLVALSKSRDVRCAGLVWCIDEFEARGVDLTVLARGIARIQAEEPTNSPEELGMRRDRYEALSEAEARAARRSGTARADTGGGKASQPVRLGRRPTRTPGARDGSPGGASRQPAS